MLKKLLMILSQMVLKNMLLIFCTLLGKNFVCIFKFMVILYNQRCAELLFISQTKQIIPAY